VFRVTHRLIILLASANLLDQTSPGQHDLPVVNVPENGQTLAKLLELCYPVDGTDWGSLDSTLAVLQAATKYQMKKMIRLVKQQCMQHVKTVTLRIFSTAIQYGREQEARKAARRAVNLPIEDVCVPEMESASAISYHHLLRYHHECKSVIARLTCGYHIPSFLETWNTDYAAWWDGSFNQQSNPSAVPAQIAAPIVQRELRGRAGLGQFVRGLIDESQVLEGKLKDALATVSPPQ
jgi:hypothetical protein